MTFYHSRLNLWLIGAKYYDIVLILLENGAYVNNQLSCGSPIASEISYNHYDIVELLLKYGSDFDFNFIDNYYKYGIY